MTYASRFGGRDGEEADEEEAADGRAARAASQVAGAFALTRDDGVHLRTAALTMRDGLPPIEGQLTCTASVSISPMGRS